MYKPKNNNSWINKQKNSTNNSANPLLHFSLETKKFEKIAGITPAKTQNRVSNRLITLYIVAENYNNLYYRYLTTISE